MFFFFIIFIISKRLRFPKRLHTCLYMQVYVLPYTHTCAGMCTWTFTYGYILENNCLIKGIEKKTSNKRNLLLPANRWLDLAGKESLEVRSQYIYTGQVVVIVIVVVVCVQILLCSWVGWQPTSWSWSLDTRGRSGQHAAGHRRQSDRCRGRRPRAA